MDASQIGRTSAEPRRALQIRCRALFEYVEQLPCCSLPQAWLTSSQNRPIAARSDDPASVRLEGLIPLDGAPLEEKYRYILEKPGL